MRQTCFATKVASPKALDFYVFRTYPFQKAASYIKESALTCFQFLKEIPKKTMVVFDFKRFVWEDLCRALNRSRVK